MKKYVIFWLVSILVLTNLCAGRILRDLSHGYQYNVGQSSGGGSFLQASTSSYVPNASGSLNAQSSLGGAGFSGGSNSLSSSFGSGSSDFTGGISGPGGSSSYYNGDSTQINYQEQQYAFHHQAPIITKHFYIHTAPEDHDEQQIVRYINIGRPQQNYRVVFINTPSSSISKAKIIANVAPTEDKTAIYVLSKKSNALDVHAEAVTQASISHKPEIFFIKYKTPAEAEHAQRVIQAQYDSIGGASQVTNEGIIPVSSVIGSLGGGSEGAENTQNIDTAVNVINTGEISQNNYLPAQKKL